MPLENKEPFEKSFGHDFSKVRLYADDRAAELAEAEMARAFTVGRNIFFGAGPYQPDTPSGRHLLAHELAHVTQQAADGHPVVDRMALAPEPDSKKLFETTVHGSREKNGRWSPRRLLGWRK